MRHRLVIHNHLPVQDVGEEEEWRITCNMKDPAAFTTAAWVNKTAKIRTIFGQQDAEERTVRLFKKHGYRNIKVVAAAKT